MKGKKLIYDRFEEDEVLKDIEYEVSNGWELHHQGWVNSKYEVGFVKNVF